MFRDINPRAEQHFLIVPKKHLKDSTMIRCFGDMELVDHMIQVAKDFCNNDLQKDA